jgi:hypothetical protein
VRGVLTVAVIVALQAVSIELVRQATMGFAWNAALATATPYIAGVCAAVATFVATPRRRALAPVVEDGPATSQERSSRLMAKASTGMP